MDFLLKTLSPQLLVSLLPMILIKIGSWLKNKDENATGKDDAFGNILIALAPAIAAVEDKQDISLKKALRVVRDTITGYLGE